MTARHLFARQPQGSITVSQPFHPNAIRQNIRATTQPNNSRETGMTALYALCRRCGATDRYSDGHCRQCANRRAIAAYDRRKPGRKPRPIGKRSRKHQQHSPSSN
jgi:hypothetical protein